MPPNNLAKPISGDRIVRVPIAPETFVRAFRTGASHCAYVVEAGLPAGAAVTWIGLDEFGDMQVHVRHESFRLLMPGEVPPILVLELRKADG